VEAEEMRPEWETAETYSEYLGYCEHAQPLEEVEEELDAEKETISIGDYVYWFFSALWYWLQMLPRRVYWFFQRGFRGYSDCDWWNLNSYLAGWLPDALMRLRNEGHGHPGMMTEEEWQDTLLQMLAGFVAHRRLRNCDWETLAQRDELVEVREDGLALFAEWFVELRACPTLLTEVREQRALLRRMAPKNTRFEDWLAVKMQEPEFREAFEALRKKDDNAMS
jgi:hypothetical protein